MSDLERILKLASHGTDKAQGQAPAERELKERLTPDQKAAIASTGPYSDYGYDDVDPMSVKTKGGKLSDPTTRRKGTGHPSKMDPELKARMGSGHPSAPAPDMPDMPDLDDGPKHIDYTDDVGKYTDMKEPRLFGKSKPDADYPDAIMRLADRMARQKNIDALSKNYDDRIQRMSRAESVEEAVGEFAEPIYDLIDMHFEGDCQPVFDDLVRFLSGDQIKEFVDDFRRHHDLPMGDEETDESVEPTEPSTEEGNEFSGALAKAKEEGKDEFEVDGKKYKVKEEAKTEEESEAVEEAKTEEESEAVEEAKTEEELEAVEESNTEEDTEAVEESNTEEDTAEEISEAPTMDTTQLITLLKNAGLSEEAIDKKLNEWANTPAGAAEEEATSHGEPYENFAQSVNLSLKRYLDAEDMKVGLKEHKVEDIKEAYKKSKEK